MEGPDPRQPGPRRVLVFSLAAVACLAVATFASGAALATLTTAPTASERAAAAAVAMADRWRSWPAGRIFPATLGYQTDLLTSETASRVGISPEDSCAAAVDVGVRSLEIREHCRAGLRATYIDGLQGIVYTIGVLAFPSSHDAAAFFGALPTGGRLSGTVRAFALAGTGAARFTDAARQFAKARRAGPFVVLVAAGYADGRARSATAEPRPSIFSPASELAAEILRPLTAPVAVQCGTPQWSC